MLNKGKFNILGVLVNAVDYEFAVEKIIFSAKRKKPFIVSALATHGVVVGFQDSVHQARLNSFDLIVPDGQPVRWAMNLIYNTCLPDRVYGPNLMLRVCSACADEKIPIYLYGSSSSVLEKLEINLKKNFSNLIVAGKSPSRFKTITEEEQDQIISQIKESGAKLVFVGLGCPRQEVWAYENRNKIGIPLLAVGAAFDFHAKILKQAPKWMQNYGLEWFFRLILEPRRLWRRYLILNTIYIILLVTQFFKIRSFSPILKHDKTKDYINYG